MKILRSKTKACSKCRTPMFPLRIEIGDKIIRIWKCYNCGYKEDRTNEIILWKVSESVKLKAE